MLRTLLFLLYLLVFTPIGLVSRLVRDPLRRKWDSRAQTYWVLVDRR